MKPTNNGSQRQKAVRSIARQVNQLNLDRSSSKPLSEQIKSEVTKMVKAKAKSVARSGLKKVGGIFKKITGMGDYTISNQVMANSLVRGAQVPVSFTNKAAHRVVQSEFLTDILGTSSFTLQDFQLNPGIFTPWLSQIASLYDEWSPNGIVFEIRTTSSDYSAATGLGTIIAAVDYDAIHPTYTTKVEMESAEGSISGKPSCSLFCGVECDPKQRPTLLLYTRTDPAPLGTDIRLYDLGRMSIATAGQAGSAIGAALAELWVHYDISFYKRRLNPASLVPIVPRAFVAFSYNATPLHDGTTMFAATSPPQNMYSSGGLSCLVGHSSLVISNSIPGYTYLVMVTSKDDGSGLSSSLVPCLSSEAGGFLNALVVTNGTQVPDDLVSFLFPVGYNITHPGNPFARADFDNINGVTECTFTFALTSAATAGHPLTVSLYGTSGINHAKSVKVQVLEQPPGSLLWSPA